MQQQSGINEAPDPELALLVRRKNALSRTLTLVMFVVYFGFIVTLAFAPDVLSARVGAATLGIPLGLGVIVLTWILMGIYVRWTNGAYDATIARLKSK